MIKTVASLVCCLFAAGGFGLLRGAQTDRAHDEWLRERYAEATSIKAGMTRADLLKHFEADGGVQRLLPTRYVLKGSSMIKVDVEFDVPESAQGKLVPEDQTVPPVDSAKGSYQVISNEKLKIKSISRPYLEPFDID